MLLNIHRGQSPFSSRISIGLRGLGYDGISLYRQKFRIGDSHSTDRFCINADGRGLDCRRTTHRNSRDANHRMDVLQREKPHSNSGWRTDVDAVRWERGNLLSCFKMSCGFQPFLWKGNLQTGSYSQRRMRQRVPLYGVGVVRKFRS